MHSHSDEKAPPRSMGGSHLAIDCHPFLLCPVPLVAGIAAVVRADQASLAKLELA